ncbi:hypothetical protein JB92DRAFT_1087881 [Gautieria morchelliformis]|nr:hypothetical protein JB92DRAFT_1087881 [Gautieria morchelliformis]
MSCRDVILASVFGTVGFVALVGVLFLLIRYWIRHRDASEDMVIQRPTHLVQDTPDTSFYQSPPLPAPAPVSPTPRTLDTPDRAYIPDHPYASALSYHETRNSVPPTPPPKTAPIPYPPLPLTIPHPYTQGAQPQRPGRVPSADPSTIYESFMSQTRSSTPAEAPPIEPMEPSPLASTIGGAINASHFDALLSAALSDEAPSSMSASSSKPLRPGDKPPRR